MQKHLITKKEREELSILLGQTCPDFCLKLDANQRLQLEDLLNEKLQENKEGFYSLVDYWSKKAIEMAENKDIVESEKIVLKI